MLFNIQQKHFFVLKHYIELSKTLTTYNLYHVFLFNHQMENNRKYIITFDKQQFGMSQLTLRFQDRW